MKSILLADSRTDLLATIETILKHWGYRVLSTRKANQVSTFLQQSEPCLLIIGEDLLSDQALDLDKTVKTNITSGALPCLALHHDGAKASRIPVDAKLDIPLDIFELFSFIQHKVEKHPRQNLRLRLRLPGMYSLDEDYFVMADVVTLSTRGLFFKASAKVRKGDRINVVFPLLGQGKEIEVLSTVLYTIQPQAENNYFQGFGVGFDDMTESEEQQLQHYIKEHFLKEVSASNNGVSDFTEGQLKG